MFGVCVEKGTGYFFVWKPAGRFEGYTVSQI